MTDIKNKKILIIVESPNKTKYISKFLKDAGYKHVTVMASVGHIMELADGGSYHNSGITPDDDFKMNLRVSCSKKEITDSLKKAVATNDIVYLMSDGDREGEAIAWSLVKFLKIPKTKYKRAITHEITPKAVVHAIENPVKLSDDLVQAALARMTVDKMIGYALSPIAKTYVGARSVGRCQSAGLKLVTDREREIINFVPSDYYDLYLNFSKNNTKFQAKYVGTDEEPVDHLSTQEAVDEVKFLCKSDYIVKDVVSKTRYESPKPPFSTATFQQEASSKLGISVKDAMRYAQDGFTSGYYNYLRTDSTDMAPEFLPVLMNYVRANYGKAVSPRTSKKAEHEQDGHECFRVIDPNLTPELYEQKNGSGMAAKVYKLVWQRTIASVMENAEIDETTYNIYNNKQKFILVSSELKKPGYRQVYSYDTAKDKSAPIKETFDKNEKLENTNLIDIKKQTTPPARYTEASLVKKLQTDGIGRPSTFSTIVETILSPVRGYCKLEDKKIVPTDRGMQLSDFLNRSFSSVISLTYTSTMESDLDEIAAGNKTKHDFLTTFYLGLEDALAKNKAMMPKPIMKKTDKVCPNCGAPMVLRRSRFGKMFYGCSNYPKCRGILPYDDK